MASFTDDDWDWDMFDLTVVWCNRCGWREETTANIDSEKIFADHWEVCVYNDDEETISG